MQKLNVKHFTHNEDTKMFTAEISDLPANSLDTHITLVSDMGCEATFVRWSTMRSEDIDVEIVGWEYRPSAETLERIPRLKGYSLTVFND